MTAVTRGRRRMFGPISNDTRGLGVTRHLVGGEGACRWKQLLNGMHLDGQWNCVEYVIIPPGCSCGEHLHAETEEIYYIISGSAVMHIDGKRRQVRGGDLITTPIGTAHTIANHGDEDMHFFVVEVFPGSKSGGGPEHIPIRERMTTRQVYRGAAQPVRLARVDLTGYFTGDWHSFSVLELPPGGSLGRYGLDDRVEVLLVTRGQSAAITVGDERLVGGPGLCVSAPALMPRQVENLSGDQPLELISTEVLVG
ncbi:MAG: cupin domain-containing protein [Actinomycetota bacterium]|nr:cupin domain-containing protein [Actinomycetota bacterium]